MPDHMMRARVERLIRGDVREDDLTRLFLFARDRCDGSECVQEIGDFVAHHSERTKGVVTQTVRDWAAIVGCRPWVPGETLDPQYFPNVFPDYLRATARRLEHKLIKAHTDLTRAQVIAKLPLIITWLQANNDRTFALYPFYTKQELAIVNCLF